MVSTIIGYALPLYFVTCNIKEIMINIPCKDNAHEFVSVSTSSSNGSIYSSGTKWIQCRLCGNIGVTVSTTHNAVNVHDLSSVAKQRRKEGSL
jgi:hypothetical protein